MRREPLLNRQLILESPDGVPDGLGGRQGGWTERGRHWAEVRTKGAGIRQDNGREIAENRATILIRSSLPGADSRPRASDRFREGARIFEILTVAEAGTEGRFLICETREILA